MGKRLNKTHFMAGLAAGGAALAVLSTPVGLIELVVTSTGLSEILPAAAPPLGMTARLLIAGFAAVMAAGTTLAFPKSSNSQNNKGAGLPADGDQKMGFALSKLAAFTRGRDRRSVEDMPVLRRADAHPDAPARRPIFASTDFSGVEIFRPATASVASIAPADTVVPIVEEEEGVAVVAEATTAPFYVEEEKDPIIDGTGLTLPSTPEPLPDAVMLAFAARHVARLPILEEPVVQHVSAQPAESAPLPFAAPQAETLVFAAPAPSTVEASISQAEAIIAPTLASEDASIAELAARFERGLARRIALSEAAKAARHAETVLTRHVDAGRQPTLADIPPAQPVPVRADVDQEVEQALRAALGTLHKMTSRAG